MTNKETAEIIKTAIAEVEWEYPMEYAAAFDRAIKALEQEPCEDAISRAEAIRIASGYCHYTNIPKELEKLPSVHLEPNKGHCKDCKWWKDSDGMFRRGIDAESKCPINRKEVYEGNGCCFMFEPQESDGEE